jgi:hypothetical protein
MLGCCFVGVAVFGLADVKLLLRLLLAASGDVLVLKPLPFIKLWHTFSVLS